MSLLSEKAREIYKSHDGYSPAAVEELERAIMADRTLMREAAHAAADGALMLTQRQIRHQLSCPPAPQPAYQRYTPELNERLGEPSLFDWPLMRGIKLIDATREQIMEDVERYEAHAEGSLRNARFLRLVAQKLREGESVRTSGLTEKELKKLQTKANNRRQPAA